MSEYKDDSDDESLPELFTNIPSTTLQLPVKKSMEQLLHDATSLSKECKIDQELDQANRSILEDYQLKCSSESIYESTSPPTNEMTEELEFKLFSSNNYLQFFNLRDISLQSCGYSLKNLTEFEKLLISIAPVKLENILPTILSICSSSICIHTRIHQVKPFVLYLLKILSVHEKEMTVQACEHALKSVLDCQSTISFSSSEMFVMLFNYGVEFANLEVLASSSNIEKPSKSYGCLSVIPSNWLYNLERLLSVIKDLIFALSFSNDDLLLLIKYFLFTHLDTLIQCEYRVSSQLKSCLVEALNALSEEKWPSSFSDISKFVLSFEKISSTNHWSHIYNMSKFIPDYTKRGSELRKYISISSLKILSDCDIEKEPSLLNIEYTVSDLMYILSNQTYLLQTQKINTYLNFVIKFIDICIQHLKLESEEEYKDLFISLKNFEDRFIAINESTMQEQKHLVRILTRLQLQTPDSKLELVPHLHNIKIEANCDYEQNGPIIHNIGSEIDYDSEQSLRNDLFVSRELTEIKKEIISDIFEETTNNSFNDPNELFHSGPIIHNNGSEIDYNSEQSLRNDVFVSRELTEIKNENSSSPVISDIYEETTSNSFNDPKELFHTVKENTPNDNAEEKENIQNHTKVFMGEKKTSKNDQLFKLAKDKTLNLKTHSNSNINSHVKTLRLENRNHSFNEKFDTEQTPSFNLQTHSFSSQDFNSGLTVHSLGKKETLIFEKEIIEDEDSENDSDMKQQYLKNKHSAIDCIDKILSSGDKISKYSNSLYDDMDDFYFKKNSASLFDGDFEKKINIQPSNLASDSSIRASVRTSGNDNIFNIEINSPQSLDQITDINLRVSTKHVKYPENVNKSTTSEELTQSSFFSKQKIERLHSHVPDVCMIVKDKDKNEVILVSDDEDDEIQIVSINTNITPNTPILQKALSNITKKTISHSPQNSNSQLTPKKSYQKSYSLYNFLETTPNKKFKPNNTAKIPVISSSVHDEESDVMIIDHLSDDDCKIISQEEEVLLLD